MTVIKDLFFGGSEKKAAKAQTQALKEGQAFTREGVEQARGDLLNLFPAAQQNLQQGFQGALDVFGQSLPAQVQSFQQGNVAAQQQLLAGLPQFQNAILGGNIDFGQLQPSTVPLPDLSFFQQQLPQSQSGIEPEQPLSPLPPQFAAGDGVASNFGLVPTGQVSPEIFPFNPANNIQPGGMQLGGALGGGFGGGLTIGGSPLGDLFGAPGSQNQRFGSFGQF